MMISRHLPRPDSPAPVPLNSAERPIWAGAHCVEHQQQHGSATQTSALCLFYWSRVQQEMPRWSRRRRRVPWGRRRRRRRRRRGGWRMVPWGPQMTRGSAPRGISGPSPPNHYQPSEYSRPCHHHRSRLIISPSAITVHSSAVTKLWESSHQSGLSNRHKITKSSTKLPLSVAIATICNLLPNTHSSVTKRLDFRQRPKYSSFKSSWVPSHSSRLQK